MSLPRDCVPQEDDNHLCVRIGVVQGAGRISQLKALTSQTPTHRALHMPQLEIHAILGARLFALLAETPASASAPIETRTACVRQVCVGSRKDSRTSLCRFTIYSFNLRRSCSHMTFPSSLFHFQLCFRFFCFYFCQSVYPSSCLSVYLFVWWAVLSCALPPAKPELK